MSDAVLTDCPACGASTFKKQLTAAGFQLKGSGWYVTDFKGGAAATGVASGEKSEGASDTSSVGKSDAGADGSASTAKADSKIETKSAAAPEAKAVAKPDTPSPAKTSPSATPTTSN
jgi:predicted nucleic acid-binding Zn ribbon protein